MALDWRKLVMPLAFRQEMTARLFLPRLAADYAAPAVARFLASGKLCARRARRLA